ncbi:hypothetical protein KDA_37730 [Dictyobacter alpinus]|uniref:Uncharacterized protein n=1 Tax=Dictyobacter alpinus TaxID=2014873 RepID=A0A402BAE3_9CHLR|nr:hypothetical protein KDA_37730 [Dictyobacter alpinus]
MRCLALVKSLDDIVLPKVLAFLKNSIVFLGFAAHDFIPFFTILQLNEQYKIIRIKKYVKSGFRASVLV